MNRPSRGVGSATEFVTRWTGWDQRGNRIPLGGQRGTLGVPTSIFRLMSWQRNLTFHPSSFSAPSWIDCLRNGPRLLWMKLPSSSLLPPYEENFDFAATSIFEVLWREESRGDRTGIVQIHPDRNVFRAAFSAGNSWVTLYEVNEWKRNGGFAEFSGERMNPLVPGKISRVQLILISFQMLPPPIGHISALRSLHVRLAWYARF